MYKFNMLAFPRAHAWSEKPRPYHFTHSPMYFKGRHFCSVSMILVCSTEQKSVSQAESSVCTCFAAQFNINALLRFDQKGLGFLLILAVLIQYNIYML